VPPHIAASIPSEFATQTTAAVTVTAIAINGSVFEAAAKVVLAKAVISTAPPIAASLRIGRKNTDGKRGAC
jgi:hypothetical protein